MRTEVLVTNLDIRDLCDALAEVFRLSCEMESVGGHFQEVISEIFMDFGIPVEADWEHGKAKFNPTL